MAQSTLLNHTWQVYKRNFGLIMAMALPGLFGLLIPLVAGTPAFVSIGGAYLRTGSIPDLDPFSAGLMLVSLLVSLFLMSFAIVNINLVIKSQRTLTQMGQSVLRSLTTTTISVFWVYLITVLILFITQLLTFEMDGQQFVVPLVTLAVGLATLFMPTAMVIDELRPYRALERSVGMVLKKGPLVLFWLGALLLAISIVTGLLLWLAPHPWGSWLVIIFNSLFVTPFMVVLLGQIYISKYTILEKN